MTVEGVALRPRRKWGWVFVVALVLEAIFFIAVIGAHYADIGRELSVQKSFLESAANGRPSDRSANMGEADFSSRRIEQYRNEIPMLYTAAGIVMIVTFSVAFIGLRRRKRA